MVEACGRGSADASGGVDGAGGDGGREMRVRTPFAKKRIVAAVEDRSARNIAASSSSTGSDIFVQAGGIEQLRRVVSRMLN